MKSRRVTQEQAINWQLAATIFRGLQFEFGDKTSQDKTSPRRANVSFMYENGGFSEMR